MEYGYGKKIRICHICPTLLINKLFYNHIFVQIMRQILLFFFNRYFLIFVLTLACLTSHAMTLKPIITADEFDLPVNIYPFCEINKNNYWFFYIFEIIGIQGNAFWVTGFCVLLVTFLLEICHQLEMLSDKIKELPNAVKSHLQKNSKESKLDVEKKYFSQIIQQHQKIFE